MHTRVRRSRRVPSLPCPRVPCPSLPSLPPCLPTSHADASVVTECARGRPPRARAPVHPTPPPHRARAARATPRHRHPQAAHGGRRLRTLLIWNDARPSTPRMLTCSLPSAAVVSGSPSAASMAACPCEAPAGTSMRRHALGPIHGRCLALAPVTVTTGRGDVRARAECARAAACRSRRWPAIFLVGFRERRAPAGCAKSGATASSMARRGTRRAVVRRLPRAAVDRPGGASEGTWFHSQFGESHEG